MCRKSNDEKGRIVMAVVPDEHPGADEIGWCHHCGTWQRGRDAVLGRDYWGRRGEHAWLCVSDDGEPWGWGVWRVRPDNQNNGLWCPKAGEHADQRAVSYCGCPCTE